ncbi:MAG: DUF354 domain-containing protein [Bacteroidia bacterium]|nr:DUF354 domain-containing protein [Bacteroidia bacterium]
MKFNMRIAVFLGHPAHFYMFRNLINNIVESGKSIHIVIKKKDILEELLKQSGLNYTVIREDRSDSKIGLIKSVLQMEFEMIKFIRKNKIDILIGSTLSFAVRIICGKHVIVTAEDDAIVIPKYAKLVYPFASVILSPISCNNGQWEQKSIKYHGFQKLTYLYPDYFNANFEVVENYISTDKPYFLIRFAKLNAHHDNGVKGLNNDIARKIIQRLEKLGNVYISSERELPEEFEKYRLNINPLDIHHLMAFATLYIGDSQSMSVEAAMLGTPSVRFNDFAGKISVLNELETKYQLTYGIHSSEPEKLFAKLDELLVLPDLKTVFQQRRQKMLTDKIDVTAFFTWFIENYPDSANVMRSNPDYQYRFK